MSGLTDVLSGVYIRTSHLKNRALFFSKINNHVQNHSYEESNEDQYVFRSVFKVRQEVKYGIQTHISYIKDELQKSIENNMMGKKEKEKIILFTW